MGNERKRGEELEVAILEAADKIIHESGYESMTFQNVAKLAETSRTVIYRRYETPVDLLHALVRYKFTQALGGNMIDLVQEKGSLRLDLLGVVEVYQQFFDAASPEVLSAMLLELSKKNEKFKQWSIRARESNIEIMKKIEGFAKERGEINHEFTSMQMSLPFDLLRSVNIISGGTVTKDYLIQLVDEVLLPIFSGNRGTVLASHSKTE
ncbi:TetR/AcrR family transcriptional regulator [Pullulanibacillus sp. KACC 23026]|uniref:TetR/AcrR family transcriptional regulator n=1 Tax=Pullulanibacillus sp. KACC 23026 TaxID=3028315 RepID=UPI0023B07AC3|nr:TetR/AcrR family transcriptional regulator [Pullulanibacillus sp. KACC 23026]WEG11086.1 TetR/AcrR family transcriptional regulator [Pullulanibacillus sp. KACC 23026]